MKFKRRGDREESLGLIEIAPLVNVILLLLIFFFMLASSLALPKGMHVELPKAVTSDIVREENFIISITGEDVIYLNSQVITIKELKRTLQTAAKDKHPVLIKADRRASLGRIVDVWDLCKEIGVERINIAANRGQ